MFGIRAPKKTSTAANAVVTGAGSGIGRAFALEIAQRGGAVLCSDINLESATETVQLIEQAGGQAWACRCDVSQLAEVEALAAKADELLPASVDLVVNNAGVGVGGQPIGEVSIDDWKWTLGINLWGVIHGCHVFTPRLRKLGRGGIINVASTASFSAAPLMGPYNVTKAGALALSETLSAELAGTGVSVTALCPTLVKTNINANGRIVGDSSKLLDRLMSRLGMSAQRVARDTLNALDRGDLYVMPQFDARMIWRAKRLIPRTYAGAAGLISRFGTSRLH
ncbi:MAG: SDR family NAD(P)-dependent oxidoreductase [Marinobacter sp.]|uniref:SDR family NAD(P)-dependent oxidoreductase n=1 Tax=Marinobacter sp. TaxID=50741 RepID=UPI00299D0431|nr:SDR family NAD(P)-dependent oxidoreductase [Marinobacter sp.]MDX1756348.1 SDR family NAD(P)-dependent oxidoreductase [Marinobacter sp.]